MPRKSQRGKIRNSGAKSIEKPKRNPGRKGASKTKAVQEEPEMILEDLNDSDSGASSDSSTWSEFGERILTRGIGTGSGTVQEESSDEGDLEEAVEPPKKIIKIAQPKKKSISPILPQVPTTKILESQRPPSSAHLQRPPSPPINPTRVKEEPLDVKPDLGPSNDPEEPFQIDPIPSPAFHGQIKLEEEPLEENTSQKTPKVPPQKQQNSKSQSPELLTFAQKLERDVDKHISEDGVCKSCLATFNEPNVLRWHVEMTHTQFRFCPFKGCIKGVVPPRIIKSHLRTHEQSPPPLEFICTFPGCTLTTTVWRYLIYHEKDAHFSYMTQKIPAKRPKFTCNYPGCSKIYEIENSLRAHIQKKHSLKAPKPKETFICEKCGVIHSNKYSFKSHLMKCTSKNTHACNFQGCGKEFKTINNWKLHLDAHKGIYKFLCEFCGIGYPSKAHYENHRVWAHLDLLPLEEKEANEAKLIKLKESNAKYKENYRKKQEELREKETEEERQKRREGYKELRIKYFEKNGEKLKEYYRNYQKGYLKRKTKTEEEKKALFAKRNEYQRQRWARMSLEERRRKNSKKRSPRPKGRRSKGERIDQIY